MITLRLYTFVIVWIALHMTALGQIFSAKGQLWGSGLLSDDPAEDESFYETQVGYIPTLSLSWGLKNDQLLDIEWAYRINRAYSGDVLLERGGKHYRGWLRYSTPKIEARLGLQKITFGPALPGPAPG